MNKRSYSQILNATASDHLQKGLDLAPKIIARIQKGKGNHMLFRKKFVFATLLTAIGITLLIVTIPVIAATVKRWFGYVPKVGLVEEGQIRVLEEPVSTTREGITVTIDQVVLNQDGTVLVYSVNGIPDSALTIDPGAAYCSNKVNLRLPDGTSLLASPRGVQSFESGYQHRYDYPALPAEINDATFVISCLYYTQEGKAPGNWEIPLHFVPAPADMTAYPVIELPAPTEPAADAPLAENAEIAEPMTLTVDRAVQMENGTLIYATLHWEKTSFASVSIDRPEETMHLRDENGQELPFAAFYDEQTGEFIDQQKTVLAIKTTQSLEPGSFTLVLDSVLGILPGDASFEFDPGVNPQVGQQFPVNLDIAIGKHILRILNTTVEDGGYSFDMSSDTGIRGASLFDMEHMIATGNEGESGNDGKEYKFYSTFYYAEGLPEGPVTITIGGIKILHEQSLTAQWTLPAQ